MLFHHLMDLENFRFTPHELGPSSKTYGYIQCTCPTELRPNILQAAQAADQPHQQELVGQIQKEYLVPSLGEDETWNEFLKCAAIAHESAFRATVTIKKMSVPTLACIRPFPGSIACRNMNTTPCTFTLSSVIRPLVNVPFRIEDRKNLPISETMMLHPSHHHRANGC